VALGWTSSDQKLTLFSLAGRPGWYHGHWCRVCRHRCRNFLHRQRLEGGHPQRGCHRNSSWAAFSDSLYSSKSSLSPSHSTELLQLSGIGDSDHLGSLGIDVVYDLPGVGMHLTDHLSAQLSFNTTGVEYTGDEVETNTTFAAEQKALWDALDPTSLYNSPNDA
jgi:hypothetical protein